MCSPNTVIHKVATSHDCIQSWNIRWCKCECFIVWCIKRKCVTYCYQQFQHSTDCFLTRGRKKKRKKERGKVSPIAITLPPTGSSHTDVQCPTGSSNLQHLNKRLCGNLTLLWEYCECRSNIVGVCLAYHHFAWMTFLSCQLWHTIL